MVTAVILLAAGQGTRMKSDHPKVLHEVAGAPLLHHAMRAAVAMRPERMIVVTGHGGQVVADAARAVDPAVRIAEQAEQFGTGHAVRMAAPELQGFEGDAIVLYADTPFVSADTLARLAEARARHEIVVLGFEPADPARYGRLISDGEALQRIVEYKDASAGERAIGLCNSGVLAAPWPLLADLLGRIGNANAAGEYYLTDIVALARAEGRSAGVVLCDEAETLGVNSRADLAAAEGAFQARARGAALEGGVTMRAPETVFLAHDTELAPDVVIEPHVVFGAGVRVGRGARIRAFCHLEGCAIAEGAEVGPHARLRPGTDIGAGARVGNFVEVKAARLGPGAKANHLSYLGDAEIGARANIGAGTITCNYDGVSKHRTVIGADAFIGSDTMLVAPVSIGEGAMTGSGSVITTNVPAGDLALARARQINRPGLARRLFERLRAARDGKRGR